MPYLHEKGRFWPKIVKVNETFEVIMMFKNSQGKKSPFSISGRTKQKKESFGAVGKISINLFLVKNKMEPHFVFSNGTSEAKLPAFMFEPQSDMKKDADGTPQTTVFGNRLANIFRNCGSECTARLLTFLTHSKGFINYNPEIHAENGTFTEEGDPLSKNDEESLSSLFEAAQQSSEHFQIEQPSPKKLKPKKPNVSRGEINKEKLSAERQNLLEAETGVPKSAEMCHEGIKLHPLTKLVIHPDVIRDIDNKKVEELYHEMKINLDASQIIFKAQLPLRKHEEFVPEMVSDDSLVLKVVSGRHRLLALQKIYQEGEEGREKLGKLLNGDQNAKEIVVPVVVMSITGQLLPNYEHLKSESSNKHSRKVLLQDYVYLYVKLLAKFKDKDRCLDIIRNMMIIMSQCNQQTINGVLSVCRLPSAILQKTCDVLKMQQEFRTLHQAKPTFLQRRFSLKQAISLHDLKIIAKTPTTHLNECNQKLIDKTFGWKAYISSCSEGNKMKKLIEFMEIQSQRSIDQLQNEFPKEFGDENLMNFINEDTATVQKFISNTVSNSGENVFDKFNVVKSGKEFKESGSADVYLLHMKKFDTQMVVYVLKDMIEGRLDSTTLLVPCKTIHEVVSVSEVIECLPPLHGIEFSNVIHFKKSSPSRPTTGYREVLDSVVVCGRKCQITTDTLHKLPMSKGLPELVLKIQPKKVKVISDCPDLIDVSSERFETHYFAFTPNVFDKMLKKRKQDKQKSMMSCDETRSCHEDGDDTMNTTASPNPKEMCKPKKSDNLTLNMKRQLSKTESVGKKKTKTSVVLNPLASPNSSSPFEPKSSSSPMKAIQKVGNSVCKNLFKDSDCKQNEKFQHEQLSDKISLSLLKLKHSNKNQISGNTPFDECLIEEVSNVTRFILVCLVTKIIQVKGGIVLSVVDGTERKIVCLLWEAVETPTLVNIKVTNEELVKLVDCKTVVVGSFVRLTGLECNMIEKKDSQGESVEFVDSQENDVDGYEFLFHSEDGMSRVEILKEEDPKAQTIKERLRRRDSIKAKVDKDAVDSVSLLAEGNTRSSLKQNNISVGEEEETGHTLKEKMGKRNSFEDKCDEIVPESVSLLSGETLKEHMRGGNSCEDKCDEIVPESVSLLSGETLKEQQKETLKEQMRGENSCEATDVSVASREPCEIKRTVGNEGEIKSLRNELDP